MSDTKTQENVISKALADRMMDDSCRIYPILADRFAGFETETPVTNKHEYLGEDYDWEEHKEYQTRYYNLLSLLSDYPPPACHICNRNTHGRALGGHFPTFCNFCRQSLIADGHAPVYKYRKVVNSLTTQMKEQLTESMNMLAHRNKEAIKPTDEQSAIWKYMADWRNGHALIKAGAGTGKTTTIVHGLAKTSRSSPCLVLAFNVSVADQMIERLNSVGVKNVHVRTMNSFGYSVLRRKFPFIKLRENKVWWHIRERFGESIRFETMLSIKSLVDLVKSYLVFLPGHDDDTGAWERYYDRLSELGDRHSVKLPKDKKAKRTQFDRVHEIATACLADTDGCDQDDQIWMPLMLNLPIPSYRMVCVDECQDINVSQWEMISRITGMFKEGRVIAVGDENQAVYGFRGADIGAVGRIENDLSKSGIGFASLPLTITQRCPKAVVAAANALVPELRPRGDMPVGSVSSINELDFYKQVKNGDMVMSRTNAPLVSSAIQCIVAGKKVLVRGRDIGKSAARLIESLEPTSISELKESLKRWYATQKSYLSFATQQRELASLEDRYKTVEVLASNSSDLGKLQNYIAILFADIENGAVPSDAVLFSTIHRAKGLESPVCYIINPQDIPYEKAIQPWEQVQERNLAYIAVTRAKYDRTNPDSGKVYFVGSVPTIYGSGYIRTMKTGIYPPPPTVLNTDEGDIDPDYDD